jgi:multidrug efflux pump subunit AcrA (membrane-fusion protein)
LAFASYYSGILKVGKEKPQKKAISNITNVVYAPVSLSESTVEIQSNGTLMAKNTVQLVSRTQGLFEKSDKPFRAGVYFKKDEVLVSIDNQEYLANLRASKAALLQSLTSILGNLKFDYPEAFDKWNAYINGFDVNRTLKELPQTTSEREKAFINSQNIITQYYDIKADEVQNSYYTIRAPFSGILTENNVDKGAMINAGQTLGTFIDPSVYELEVKISPLELERIKVGKSVKLTNGDQSKSWTGKLTRINNVIDAQSQSALAIVELRGKDLREGMFLNADITTTKLKNVAEISRNLLIDDKFVFIVKDSLLRKQAIDVMHVADKTVFVKGLEQGMWLLNNSVSGAYDGMKVNPLNVSE